VLWILLKQGDTSLIFSLLNGKAKKPCFSRCLYYFFLLWSAPKIEIFEDM